MTDLKFPNGCKKIAVCLYGQYRVGDYMMPYLKEFFKTSHHDVTIDFFCTSKISRSYFNSPHEQNNNTDQLSTVFEMSALKTHIENTVLKPKAVSIIDNDEDVKASGYQTWGRLFNSVAEVLKLKSIYELENDIEYDLVFLCRYDVLVHPMYLLDHIINWYNRCTEADYLVTFAGNMLTNFLVSNILYGNRNIQATFSGIQDLFVWGSNTAFNQVMNDSYRLIRNKINKSNEVITIHDPLSDTSDGHNGLAAMIRRNRIGFPVNQPLLTKCGGLSFTLETPFNKEKISNEGDFVFITVVREFFDLTLDPCLRSTCQAHADAWIQDANTVIHRKE